MLRNYKYTVTAETGDRPGASFSLSFTFAPPSLPLSPPSPHTRSTLLCVCYVGVYPVI